MLGLFALLHLFALAPLFSKNLPVFYIEIFLFSKFAFKITGQYQGFGCCFPSESVTNLENKGNVRQSPFLSLYWRYLKGERVKGQGKWAKSVYQKKMTESYIYWQH